MFERTIGQCGRLCEVFISDPIFDALSLTVAAGPEFEIF